MPAPEIAATRIFAPGVKELPILKSVARWTLAEARPAPITIPIRIIRLKIRWLMDATRPGEVQRKADLRMTFVRARVNDNGQGRSPTVVAMEAHDHYREPCGEDHNTVVELDPGFVLRPDDQLEIEYSGEAVCLPQGAIPTKVNLIVDAYWIPEPVEAPVLGN